jgi:hypothetical protein
MADAVYAHVTEDDASQRPLGRRSDHAFIDVYARDAPPPPGFPARSARSARLFPRLPVDGLASPFAAAVIPASW